jgi:glycosidase
VDMAKDTKKDLRNKVIYSIYVRNYSRQGTFKAIETDLERIYQLGVDIIWLLPIHPVGEKARKGILGSPYAIQDYREVNPEFGTLDDFKSLLDAIHKKGMKCIIDVVYNHTSPDSWLAQNHPEYFYRTPSGQMGNRAGNWDDIVDLDYSNLNLWDYQIETLKMWAKIVDGFRCDVAPLVPLDFWLRARHEVAEVNSDCLWVSESVEPEFILDLRSKGLTGLSDSEIFQAFDICYDYDIFKYFRGYLRGECSLSTYTEHVNMQEYIYPDNYVKLRYLENHDQARAKEIIPDENALLNWTAFIYFQKGTTLIYAGQEVENDFRPDLFNKDTVNWNTGKDISSLFYQLSKMKKNPVFTSSSYHLSAFDEDDVVLGTHVSEDQKLIGVFSFSGKNVAVGIDLADGIYKNLVDGSDVAVKNGTLQSRIAPIIIHN